MTTLRQLRDTASIGLQAMVERTVPRWPLAWIEQAQRHRLRSIVRHAYTTVPFYRTAMDAHGLRPTDFQTVADLERLPLIDGDLLRRDVHQFCSTAYSADDIERRYTSGSVSGARKVLYWEKSLMLRKMAYSERSRPVLNRLVGRAWGQRQLYILPTLSVDLTLRSMWDQRLLVPRGLAERRTVNATQPVDAILAEMNALRPHIVYSYGSFADVFIRTVIDRSLRVVGPRVWVYGGDMLSAAGRGMIEERLGCRVFTTYQALEAGRIGFQCERRDGFHLNIDLCAVRLVDADGRTVAPGQPGEIVISNLHARATVLLNYRLEDRGVLAIQPCPCGRSLPLLAALDGRTSDVIYRPDGQPLSAYAVEVHSTAVLKTRATQIIDRGPGHIEYLVVPNTGVDHAALGQEFMTEVQHLLGPSMRVDVTCVAALPARDHGKQVKVIPGAPGVNSANPVQ